METTRRMFVGAAAATAAFAQKPRDWSGKSPTRYPDEDIVVLDPRFSKYKIGNSAIERLYTGARWAEGPAWNGVGRYLVFSDIPNNRQLRWVEDDGHVSVMRPNSHYSNGNTFDYEGRQISCEHGTRRVVRYEYNGKLTVLADKFNGKKLNAPNDVIVAPDGAIWFSDPGYGALMEYEGNKGTMEIKEAVYRIDAKSGAMDKVCDDLFKPNGLCFSPDYKKLYIADTGATHYPQAKKIVQIYDVVDGKSLRNSRVFINMEWPGKGAGLSDGIRCDMDGNLWSSAGWVGEGYDGVHCFAPDGMRIGQIRLPEICANLCFGGLKRNRLFMCGSQSLYHVYTEAIGAGIA